MRNLFPWYNEPDSPERVSIWDNAIITFDANVMLSIFRMKSSARRDLLAAFKAYASQIWLSYQVAEEFYRNRESVTAVAVDQFSEYEATFDRLTADYLGKLSQLDAYPIVSPHIRDGMKEKVKGYAKEIRGSVAEDRDSFPKFLAEDDTIGKVVELFHNKIGDPPKAEELKSLIEESVSRYREKIPPGFSDGKKSKEYAAGDFILWQQSLSYAKSQNRPLIIVTSDVKEDWWHISNGHQFMRAELAKEGYEKVGKAVQLAQVKEFLEAAASLVGSPISAESVRDIEYGVDRQSDDTSIGNDRLANKLRLELDILGQAVRAADERRNRVQAWVESLKYSHPERSRPPTESAESFSARVLEQYRMINEQRVIADHELEAANVDLNEAVNRAMNAQREYYKLTGIYQNF